LGIKGRTVYSESTNLDMLSAMTATFLLVAVGRSSRPLIKRGAIKEIVGAVTSATNVVAERRVMVLGTSSIGLRTDLIRAGMNFSIYCQPCRGLSTHILVVDESTSLGKSSLGHLLDLALGVPDGLGENRHKVGHGSCHLGRSRDDQLLKDLEGSGLDLPLSSGLDLVENGRKDDIGSPWVHGLDNGLDSGESGLTDLGSLVGKSLQEDGEDTVGGRRDDVRLEEVGSPILTESGDNASTCLTGDRRLLVGQGLAFISRNSPPVNPPPNKHTLTRASQSPMDPKNSTPAFLAEPARETAASSRAALSATKSVAVSKSPDLDETSGEVAAGAMVDILYRLSATPVRAPMLP
jgi:hypothetical protein